MRRVVLKPFLISRIAMAAMGLIALSFGSTWIGDWPPAVGVPVGGVVAVVGAVAMVRGLLYRVTLEADRMRIHGYLWSRTIPKQSIVSVTRFPAVRWHDDAGSKHWSPLIGFMRGRSAPGVEDHNRGEEAELRKWLHHDRPGHR